MRFCLHYKKRRHREFSTKYLFWLTLASLSLIAGVALAASPFTWNIASPANNDPINIFPALNRADKSVIGKPSASGGILGTLTPYGTANSGWRENQLNDDTWICQNAFYTSLTNANRDSITTPVLCQTQEISVPAFRWLYSAAAANPITFTELLRLTNLGVLLPGSDASGQLGTVSTRFLSSAFSSNITLGTNTSATGLIRLSSSNIGIRGRNNANGADLNYLYADSSDFLYIGSNTNAGAGGSVAAGVVFGAGAPATSATVGFPHIPSMAGAPVGTPTLITGYVPFAWNDTDKQLEIYSPSASAWKTAGGSGGITVVTSDPVGACTNGAAVINTTNQAFLYCANSVWVKFLSASGGLASWSLIATHDTVGAAESSFSFSGLAGDSDEEYKIIAHVISDGTAKDVVLQPNGDSALTNYEVQQVYGNNTTAGAFGAVAAGNTYTGILLSATTAVSGETTTSEAIMRSKSGQKRGSIVTFGRLSTSTGSQLAMLSGTEWINSASVITSFTIATSDATSHIGVGSHFELWAPRTPQGPTGSAVLIPSVSLITSSGTYTTPANAHALDVTCVGGGGGGGGGAGSGAGGGGGSGGVTEKVFNPPAATYTVTIGAAGAGGASTPTAGGTGGATSFGTITGNGGVGGGPQGANAAGLGGTASGGDVNFQGNGGGSGSTTGNTHGGAGAAGPWGGAGLGSEADTVTGHAATSYGAGGGGGAAGNPTAGGAGFAGACLVKVF